MKRALAVVSALAALAALSGCPIAFFPLPVYCDDSPVIEGAGGSFTGETRGNSSRTGPVIPIGGGACVQGAPSPEDIYTLVVSERSSVHLDTLGSDLDTLLYIRTDCESLAPEDQIACNDDAVVGGVPQFYSSIDIDLAEGTYFVFVDGFNGDRGAYALNVVMGPPGRPAGDQCSTAPAAVEGDTATTTADFVDDTSASCGGVGAPDAYYTLVLVNDAIVTIETIAADFDTVLSLRSSCLEPESEIVCDDDGSPGGMGLSRLDLGMLAAGAYTLVVDGAAAGDAGAYTLRLTIE